MVASMVDKSGMVEMPDGSKVVLMTQLEDGSYVQIKGEGASKVTIYFGICFLFRMAQKLNMYPRSYLQVSKNQLPRHRHYHPEISVRYRHNKIIQSMEITCRPQFRLGHQAVHIIADRLQYHLIV